MNSANQTLPVAGADQSAEHRLPEGVLLAWYGDDFTGASAAMEVLQFAGLESMLFLDAPTRAQLARYPGLRGIGVASTARAQTPDWMDAELPAVFTRMRELQPALVHYKACSTLDSSPQIGSIGRAMEIAANQFEPEVIPIVIAAPQMRRYQCFGHLFAGMGDDVFRLDRHPVMARHPVTPMNESDVARHLEKQSTRLEISLVSLEDLQYKDIRLQRPEQIAAGQLAAVSLDCVDAASEAAVGRLLWVHRQTNPIVVGSQGVQFALVRHWQESGQLEVTSQTKSIGRSTAMVSVSGSVSPVTGEQIAWSRHNGFSCIAFDAVQACIGDTKAEISRVVAASVKALAAGLDPIIYTAEGPDDPAVKRFREAIAQSDLSVSQANEIIGIALGDTLHTLIEQTGVSRAVISGGDTSGYATRQLGIFALSALAPTIPGAAIFRAHADGPNDGLQLALKGGQMGSPDYFGWVRNGGGKR